MTKAFAWQLCLIAVLNLIEARRCCLEREFLVGVGFLLVDAEVGAVEVKQTVGKPVARERAQNEV